jgi:acetyl-CoA C-acetyltransferase
VPEAVIVSTARSPIGRAFKGSLKDIRPDDLLAQIVTAALDKVPALDPATIEDVYVGAADNSGEHGTNIARVVAVMLGLDRVPGTSVNRFCASSVQTTRMAFHAVKAGEGDIFLSAGVEMVSRYMALQDGERALNGKFDEARERTQQLAQSNAPWTDPRATGKLPDVYIAMGQTAENVATLRGVSRLEQDQWAVESQNRAEKAIADGFFEREITPVTLPDGTVVSKDDGPRPGTTLDKVQTLQPVFRQTGTVTAGNACPLNDGAAALVVMSDTKAQELGLSPLARIVATGVSALSPEIMGLGPVDASKQVLQRAGMAPSDIDLWEINEAFAAQVLPSAEDIGIPLEKLNVHGGAIALGHPFGMTGARIATTLINGLQTRDAQFGLETMCVAGGQGMAIIYERLS